MKQQVTFGSKGKLTLIVLSIIGLLSTAYMCALGFALWSQRAGIVGLHLFLIALVLVLDLCCFGLWQIHRKTEAGDATDLPKSDRGDVRTLFIVASITATIVLLAFALGGSVFLTVWLVDRQARRFCDETPIGSDISDATARANAIKIIWGASDKYYHNAPKGAGSPYNFYFIATFEDKAVCEVSIDREGKVTSKHVEIQSE